MAFLSFEGIISHLCDHGVNDAISESVRLSHWTLLCLGAPWKKNYMAHLRHGVIVAKASDGQWYPCRAWVGCAWNWRGRREAALKGSMIYAFTHMGSFHPLLLLLLYPSPLKSQSRGPNPGLKARILAWRPRSQPRGWDRAFWLGFGPWGWDLGLKARIWASKLGFWP